MYFSTAILITSILKNSELGQHFRSLLSDLWGGELLKQRKKILKREKFALWVSNDSFVKKILEKVTTMKKNLRDL